MNINLKHAGFFEGVGGFSLAARWAGWQTELYCEIDKRCQRVLKYHFPKAESFLDIKNSSFLKYANRIDVLTGGFPCQPYSIAGARKGKEDERHLWPEMFRAIREISPRWVVGENVRGLVNWNGGLVFDEVQTDLESEGYEVLPFLLPAAGLNAPHKRDRIWFVAFKNTHGDGWRGCFGEKESSFGQLRHFSARDNEWIQTNNDKIGFSTNASQFGEREQTNKIIPITNSREAGPEFSGISGRGISTDPTCIGLRGESNGLGNAKLFDKNSPEYNWENFPTQSPICCRNDGVPRRLVGISFSDWRRFAIKSYGNAIVPRIAHQIFSAINKYESLNLSK